MPDQLTSDPAARKLRPIARGVLDYFPLALAEVAHTSYVANEQHNPGEEMHWAKGKSRDHADCIVRHLIDRGKVDGDGLRHSAKVAWRALALLQTELEAEAAAKVITVRVTTPAAPRFPQCGEKGHGCCDLCAVYPDWESMKPPGWWWRVRVRVSDWWHGRNDPF
jgi:hypothetical protein